MDYKYFVLIAMVGAAATLLLTVWKLIGLKTRPARSCDPYGGQSAEKTFIGKLSWAFVPWPLFIAIAILGGPYILAVLMADL